jgi:hypothetical protein
MMLVEARSVVDVGGEAALIKWDRAAWYKLVSDMADFSSAMFYRDEGGRKDIQQAVRGSAHRSDVRGIT